MKITIGIVAATAIAMMVIAAISLTSLKQSSDNVDLAIMLSDDQSKSIEVIQVTR